MEDFRPLELGDKPVFDEFLAEDPPRASELTFTNLFMWRRRNRPIWSIRNECLLVILRGEGTNPLGLPPIGSGDKSDAFDFLARTLAELSDKARICRVDEDVVERHVDPEKYLVHEDRANSDYVYLAENLINLSGNKFHKKKNHLNKFVKAYDFEYRSLDEEVVSLFLDLQEDWCELRDCASSTNLMHEDRAVYEALTNQEVLGIRGGAILINSRVEAFALGEKLNPDTAVIHIEKANPLIPGLYAAINQRFCAHEWSQVRYINREQDLGIEGLRKAKLSYHPDHLVEKFTVIPKWI